MKQHSLKQNAGFNLIQISILLTVASLIMVAVLPSPQTQLRANATSVGSMYKLLTALRAYQIVNGNLPCPADPTQPIGSTNYGVAATNTGSTGNCVGGSVNAAYADSTQHIAIGMLPVRALQLPDAAALDGYGRNITYAVDTSATGCWASSSLPGAITVNDNGNNQSTVAALISHGQDGYGAWLPLQGTGSSAPRFDNGSTDPAQADNAQVQHGGGLTANGAGQFASFIIKPATSTFDDNIVYRSSQWNLNALPLKNGMPAITPPANGTYSAGQVLIFTLNYPGAVTVTGTPRLDLSALGTGTIGTSNRAYATYKSGSGTSALTFSYTVQSSDSAPTSGLSMTPGVDLNAGTISGSPCFFAPDLSKVLIGGNLWVADFSNNRVLEVSLSGTFLNGYGAGYNGIGGTVGSSGSADGKFNQPASAIVDNSGNIWVADQGNSRIQKLSSSGQWLMTIGGSPTTDTCAGTYATPTTCNMLPGYAHCCAPNAASCTCTNSAGGVNGQFDTGGNIPQQLALDNSGNLWATDWGNKRVMEFNATTGAWMKSIGGLPGYPTGLAFDQSGSLWVTTPSNQSISKCDPVGGTCTTYGTGVFGGGNAASDYVAVDSSGTIWAVDQSGNKLQKFNTSGVNTGSLAETNPNGAAFDSSGNLWISLDSSNTVIQVNPSNGTVLQTVGTGSAGTGTNPVQFNVPQSLFIGR